MSQIKERSVLVAGSKTSLRLEEAFWVGLQEISDNRGMTLSGLIGIIDAQRQLVFSSGDDPVTSGLVSNLNRPGGNITGVSFFDVPLGGNESDCCMKCYRKARALPCCLIRTLSQRMPSCMN